LMGRVVTGICHRRVALFCSCCCQLLLHGRASRASDVYAMGCLLYHVATGRRVFASECTQLLAHACLWC
jgi:serine/threonine protein kinase